MYSTYILRSIHVAGQTDRQMPMVTLGWSWWFKISANLLCWFIWHYFLDEVSANNSLLPLDGFKYLPLRCHDRRKKPRSVISSNDGCFVEFVVDRPLPALACMRSSWFQTHFFFQFKWTDKQKNPPICSKLSLVQKLCTAMINMREMKVPFSGWKVVRSLQPKDGSCFLRERAMFINHI